MKGVEAGAEDFISMPLNEAEVLSRVKMLLKGKEQPARRLGELLVEWGPLMKKSCRRPYELLREKTSKLGKPSSRWGPLTSITYTGCSARNWG